MTFGVTPEGFRAKRFDDIITELGEALKTQLGIDIDADPDSVAKVLTNIYALPLAEEWALTQSLQSMFDIDKAEGKHLDDLVGYVGLRRLQATKSTGIQYTTATTTTTLPKNSEFQDEVGNIFYNPESILVSPSACVEVSFTILGGFSSGTQFTVTVNGSTSSVTSNIGETEVSTVARLVDTVTGNNNGVTASYIQDTVEDVYTITVVNENDRTPSSISSSSNLTLVSVVSAGTVEYSSYGDYLVAENTVVQVSVGGLTTTNRYTYTSGRDQETDEELRTRHQLSLSASGGATVEAIRADILRVDGVTTAIVVENDSSEVYQGLPPKSFITVVKGGNPQEIGEALWLTKPAGIETYGTVPVQVVDSQGITQTVYYSLPEPIHMHVRVTYELYEEESGEFPYNGEEGIKDLVVDYGNSLDIGEDVIPQRFSAKIFQSFGGLQSVLVEVQSTVSEHDTPVPENWQVTSLPVGEFSEASFKEANVSILIGS